MFLPSKDGIICDFCATIHKDEFVYYSVTSTKLKLMSNIRSGVQKGKLDADMCSNCYEQLLERVNKLLGPYKRGSIKGDLSKNYKSGTFEYHLVLFDKVNANKKSEDISVDKRVMDLNLFEAYDELLEQTEVTKKKAQQEGGAWS